MFDLTGKNAIITGSSKGIGKSIALAMAKQGANVVISSRKVDVCEATAEEINNLKDEGAGKAIVIPCNISDKTALEMLVEETRSQLGQIDILVCNAATNPYFGSIKDITDDAFEKIGAYNISKAADIMLVKNYALEFGQYNIRTNAIAPGLFKTDFARALWENPEILKQSTATCPMKRIGEPDEIGGAAVFLASQAGSFVNGHTLVIDGGTVV